MQFQDLKKKKMNDFTSLSIIIKKMFSINHNEIYYFTYKTKWICR